MRRAQEFAMEARAFTAALTAACDGKVRIVCDGQACTDGITIHLPRPLDAIDREHLHGLLGIGCHEAAHVYYGTPPRFQSFVVGYASDGPELAAHCFNAVLDVADETRFEKRFPKAETYFEASTGFAARKYLATCDDSVCPNSALDAIVRGIFYARRNRISSVSDRRAIRRFTDLAPTTRRVASVLNAAKTLHGPGLPNRTDSEWRRLADLAKQLMRVLQQDGAAAETSDRSSATHSNLSSAFVTDGGGSIGELFRGMVEEATGGVVWIENNEVGGLTTDISQAAAESFRAAEPIYRRYARRILEAPAPLPAHAAPSGNRLGDLSRVATDGRALLRRVDRPRLSTAVATCLDCSLSMQDDLGRVAGTAWALSSALISAGGNLACFHFGSEVRRVPPQRMGEAAVLGSTRTDLVLREAAEWLTIQTQARQIIAIFTDGGADCASISAQESLRIHRRGIRILAGVLSHASRDAIQSSLPCAEVFEIGDDLVSGFHQAIRRLSSRT